MSKPFHGEESENLWPDDLDVGDEVEFEGRTFEVTGTGPAEASLESTGKESITAEVGRWAFTNAVYVELERSFEQDEFPEMVTREGEESGRDE